LPAGATPLAEGSTAGSKQSRKVSGGSECEHSIDIRPGLPCTVGTPRTTGLGASAKSLVNDGFDGARAPATFSAAAEAAVELLGTAGQIFR
jgi:hypothetical protein